jgi:hypothetical protein
MPPKAAAKSAEKAVKGDEGKILRKRNFSSLSSSLMPRSFRHSFPAEEVSTKQILAVDPTFRLMRPML